MEFDLEFARKQRVEAVGGGMSKHTSLLFDQSGTYNFGGAVQGLFVPFTSIPPYALHATPPFEQLVSSRFAAREAHPDGEGLVAASFQFGSPTRHPAVTINSELTFAFAPPLNSSLLDPTAEHQDWVYNTAADCTAENELDVQSRPSIAAQTSFSPSPYSASHYQNCHDESSAPDAATPRGYDSPPQLDTSQFNIGSHTLVSNGFDYYASKNMLDFGTRISEVMDFSESGSNTNPGLTADNTEFNTSFNSFSQDILDGTEMSVSFTDFKPNASSSTEVNTSFNDFSPNALSSTKINDSSIDSSQNACDSSQNSSFSIHPDISWNNFNQDSAPIMLNHGSASTNSNLPSTQAASPTSSSPSSALSPTSSSPPTSLPANRTQCLHCSATVARPGDLKRHERVHFPRQRTFPCKQRGCERKGAKGFYRRDKLRDHVRVVHGL